MIRKHTLRSVVRFGLTSAALAGLGSFMFTGSGCTGGEDIIPDAGGSGGQSGTTAGAATTAGVATSAGTNNGTSGAGVGTSGQSSGGSSGASAGGSGGSAPGGAGGSGGGSSGSGGSGGTTAEPDVAEAVKGWNGWRFEMPCKSYGGGVPLDDACTQGDVCWVGNDAVSPHNETKAIVMGGDPTKVYEFEIHARGVIEPKVHANCEKLTQEVENAGIRICKGGADGGSGFNLWSITVVDPPQLYWLNDSDTDSHRTNILDGKFKVQARGGTTVTFKFDNKNTGQINNGCPGFRKVAPAVAPAPAYYKGNFFQLDVIEGSVKILP